jgi:hypothetical protein
MKNPNTKILKDWHSRVFSCYLHHSFKSDTNAIITNITIAVSYTKK